MTNCTAVAETVRAYVRRSVGQIWPLASRLSGSLKVIGTVKGRPAAYD